MRSNEELYNLCENWDGSIEQFSIIVSTAIKHEPHITSLADELQVAKSTVVRWASGVARPHPRI